MKRPIQPKLFFALLALVLLVACHQAVASTFRTANTSPPTITPSPTASSTPSPAPSPTSTPTPMSTSTPTPLPTPTPTLPNLTLEDVFRQKPGLPSNLDPQRLRTIIATGDVIPARSVDGQIRARGNDFLYPFAETAHVLRSGDITLVNLEAPLIANCPPHSEGYVFCGQIGFVAGLVQAGVDIVTLENNHINDYGPKGVASTKETLKQYSIDWADSSTMAVRSVRGLRFGFLAFNGVGKTIDQQKMTASIQQARTQVDVLIVSCHWGKEYVVLPQPDPWLAPDDPVTIAHLAVDAGADLVIGNHPHWVQAVEFYRGKLIAYAHGNFIFDQMWSPQVRRGVVGRYTFLDRRMVRVEYLPVLIENYVQPRFLPEKEAKAVLDSMYQASLDLAASQKSSQPKKT